MFKWHTLSIDPEYIFQGLVDLNKEITKLESKEKRLNEQLEKLLSSMKIPDYETKVSKNYYC